ncbi:MAG: photosynthetic reaction center cytochrome PufC [Paracoccaceae bacterium]|nr:photosynthetic reaction center cytochrome PufC [Paracoccaceae bacterium]
MLRKIFALPDWYDDWNQKDPVRYTKAIVFAILGVAVISVTTIIVVIHPYGTDSLQTGPRGTGMSVPEFKFDLAKPDPDIAKLAEIGDLDGDIIKAMQAWTGIPNLFEDPDSYQYAVGAMMIAMTQNINENWDGHVNANGEVGVTCYTCHRGQAVPSEIWFTIAPVTKATAGWASVQNRATSLSQSTSLPSNALESYLLDTQTIGVHDLESRVAGVPGQDDYPGIQHAERTYALMNYFSNSLGVNCVFCHNSRAFYDGGQVTPQWATANLGILMVQELNNDYIVPAGALLPEERLGPRNGDEPKVACKTCHKGYQQPLQGTNVIGDWPVLQSTEEVVELP